MTLQNFSQNKLRDVRLSIIALLSMHEILQSHLFLMSQNFEIQVVNSIESNGLNLFSRLREIVK